MQNSSFQRALDLQKEPISAERCHFCRTTLFRFFLYFGRKEYLWKALFLLSAEWQNSSFGRPLAFGEEWRIPNDKIILSPVIQISNYERTHLRESCDVSSPLEELRLVLKGSKYFDGACNELDSMSNICCHKIKGDLLVSRWPSSGGAPPAWSRARCSGPGRGPRGGRSRWSQLFAAPFAGELSLRQFTSDFSLTSWQHNKILPMTVMFTVLSKVMKVGVSTVISHLKESTRLSFKFEYRDGSKCQSQIVRILHSSSGRSGMQQQEQNSPNLGTTF